MPDQESRRDRITHDLMNQLGIVIGFAELLLGDTADDDPRRADIAELHLAASRAVALVEDLAVPPPAEDEP